MGRLDTYIGNCGGVRLLEGGRPKAAPTAEFGLKTAGAQCATPTGEGAETWPLIRPSVRTGAPVPIPSVPSGHLPLTRGVGPQVEGSEKTKRDRSGTCPLKHRGETQFRTKFLCLLSFSKKVSPGSEEPGLLAYCFNSGSLVPQPRGFLMAAWAPVTQT